MDQKNNNQDLFSAKINNLIYKKKQYYCNIASLFMNEIELAKAIKIIGSQSQFIISGGCDNAFRNKIILIEDDSFIESEIVCLTTRINDNFCEIKHKDILGSLMSLGIDRNRFGDCFKVDKNIIVYCDKAISNYVIDNFKQIKRLNVSFSISEININQQVKYITSTINVTSFRIDAIVACLANISRDKAKELIDETNVMINHEIVEDCKRLCNNECTIVIRKIGKFIVYCDDFKTSKKNRYIINVKQFA